jgi:hypothetical protein
MAPKSVCQFPFDVKILLYGKLYDKNDFMVEILGGNENISLTHENHGQQKIPHE